MAPLEMYYGYHVGQSITNYKGLYYFLSNSVMFDLSK